MAAFLAAGLLFAGAPMRPVALADEGHRAGLVVLGEDGQTVTSCISFQEDELSGAELLTRSSLEVILDLSGFMGVTICQIEGLGCAFPEEPCFCQCMGGGGCAYWNYYYRDGVGDEWVYSPLGAALHKARHGSVEAWVWGDGHTPPDDALTFAAICAPSTPLPAPTERNPTSMPPTATAEPHHTSVPTRTPTARPAATNAPSPTPPSMSGPSTTASASQGLTGYWPFVLMALGLAGLGAFFWARRTWPRSGD
jgi:hypothetical protein